MMVRLLKESFGDERIENFTPEGLEHRKGRFAAQCADEQDGVLYLAAAFTGLRMGELLGLHWEDVDFAQATIRVQRNWSGGRRGRRRAAGGGRCR